MSQLRKLDRLQIVRRYPQGSSLGLDVATDPDGGSLRVGLNPEFGANHLIEICRQQFDDVGAAKDDQMAAVFGPAREATLARELTKLHEEIRRARLGELAAMARDGSLTIKGEFVIVVDNSNRINTVLSLRRRDPGLPSPIQEQQR